MHIVGARWGTGVQYSQSHVDAAEPVVQLEPNSTNANGHSFLVFFLRLDLPVHPGIGRITAVESAACRTFVSENSIQPSDSCSQMTRAIVVFE